MTTDRKLEYLVSLVHGLCKLPQETEWVELDGYLTGYPLESLVERYSELPSPCLAICYINKFYLTAV
jgi:hypothetical protein